MTTFEAEKQRKRYITESMKLSLENVEEDTIYGNSSTIYSKITVKTTGETVYLKHLNTGEEETTEDVVLDDTINKNTKINKFKEEMRVVTDNKQQSTNNREKIEDNEPKVVTLGEAQNALIDAGIIEKKGIESDTQRPTIINCLSKNGKLVVVLSNKTVYVLAKDKNGEVIIETSSLGDR